MRVGEYADVNRYAAYAFGCRGGDEELGFLLSVRTTMYDNMYDNMFDQEK